MLLVWPSERPRFCLSLRRSVLYAEWLCNPLRHSFVTVALGRGSESLASISFLFVGILFGPGGLHFKIGAGHISILVLNDPCC